MTIGIGVVCEGVKYVLLCADMRSTVKTRKGPIHNDWVGKMFEVSSHCCACTADNMSWTQSVGSHLCRNVSQLSPENRTLDAITKCLEDAHEAVWLRYVNYKLRPLGISRSEYISSGKKIRPDLLEKAEAIVGDAIRLPVEMIIGGYWGKRPIFLKYSGLADNIVLDPAGGSGMFTIGSGSVLAFEALAKRGQNIHNSIQRSLFNVCEAKVAAEKEPSGSVGPNTQVLMVSEAGLIPLNAANIGTWYQQMSKDFKELDAEQFMQLICQKSALEAGGAS